MPWQVPRRVPGPGLRAAAHCWRVQEKRKIAGHYMEAYRLSMLAALRLQFTRRGLPGGRSGVLTLLKTNAALRELLAAEGCVWVLLF